MDIFNKEIYKFVTLIECPGLIVAARLRGEI